MSEPLATLLVPALLSTPRLYADQLPHLWRFGPVTVADHTRDDSVSAIAKRILADAPSRFALVGLSMGGYTALEILRQAPGRVIKLALLDTSARPDAPEQSEGRRAMMALARSGRFGEIADMMYPRLVDKSRHNDAALKQIVRTMAQEIGPEAFVRQQSAIMNRPDSRATLTSIRCPTLVLVGESDALTPPELASELAAGISASRLVKVPGSGHLSSLEQPAAVTRALVELLQS
ncbi:MAG TPA: alpha/beta fold hydrolase [Steroidobacteraceae bacterium]|jgi:pimeloyl-ACP methyl ester carboxylesterase